ncbi:MAG TPA: GNAT family N-acetyltransferase [Gemmatimonadaceae bacterium]
MNSDPGERGLTSGKVIVTERLEIIPATRDMIRAALVSSHALSSSLGATVPPTWPPTYLDSAALRYSLDRFPEEPEQAPWWLYFVVLSRGESGRTLIGSVGYKGPPLADGTIEVGYGIVSDQHRRGYATETVRGLLARAFSAPTVRRVIAETLPELEGSIGVLRKCGFTLVDGGSEPGVIRFELGRAAYAMRA